jgi:ABC-type transport system involved in cytochrome c biogenesis permease subunit
MDTISEVPAAADYKVIRVDYPDILTQLGLDAGQKHFSLNDLIAQKDLVQKQFELASQTPEKQRDLYQKRIIELAQHIELYLEIREPGRLLLVPAAKENADWGPLMSGDHLAPGAERFIQLLQAYRDGRTRDFNQGVADYHASIAQNLPTSMAKVDFETFFNKLSPFYLCLWFYVLVFVLACFSWLGWRKPLWSAAMGLLLVTLVVHTFGLISRVYLTGRGPVTNLYSSAIFIAWAAVLLAIGLESIYRNGLGAAVASLMGFASLLVAHYLGNDGDTMKPVVAVLATNFWLWTHVPCVTLGYASTFLSGMLAIAYVVLGLFTRVLDADRRKALARMVYGITYFAILFSFVGTILGGIWADYSWGRFWGWDPKENGAILIVLWNAIILHARWGGMVKERGTMLLAIVGNIVTSWSWFGTNLMGIGLHSYGFMDGAATALVWFWVSQALLIGIGLIPTRLWRGIGETRTAASRQLSVSV